MKSLSLLLLVCLLQGCPQEEVRSDGKDWRYKYTDELTNRLELVELLSEMRNGYENKSVETLVALASKSFYEKSGTADTSDDYDYYRLRHVLDKNFKMAKQITIDIRLRSMKIIGEVAEINYYHVTRFLISNEAGEKWVAVDDESQMRLAREGGKWKVLNGL
ncbi:MAG: hypothetical protein JRJ87_21970 [Deltaproteobacteria bacterium]|nr:hypothetical protein [Deltaproteobacteria bacterium]